MEPKKNMELVLDYVEKCKNKNILVIGDSILDEYTYGTLVGTALETPETPKAVHDDTKYFFGGAAGVVTNLIELGSKVKFITLLGRDEYSKHYDNFKHENLTIIPILEKDRVTTVKRRFWIDGKKLLQLNHLDNRDISQDSKTEIIESFKQEIEKSDLVLLVDYRHGLMTQDLINEIKHIIKESGKKSIASSQTSRRASNHEDYSGVDLICLNKREASELAEEFDSLPKKYNSNFCVTLGEQGSELYVNGEYHKVDAIKINQVEDAVGAGDCFLAALALSDFYTNPKESLFIANNWAGLSVGLPGNEGPKLNNLIRYVGGSDGNFKTKR